MKNTLVSLLLAVAAASCSAAETVASGQLSEAALQPFWQSDTMVDESVLFVRQPGAETAEAALLFEPTRILSVRTSAQDVNYIEDRDYIWTPGTKQIRLGKHSGIVWKNPQDLRRPANSQRYALDASRRQRRDPVRRRARIPRHADARDVHAQARRVGRAHSGVRR